MKLQDVTRDICTTESAILNALVEIKSGNFEHYRPHDERLLIAMLASHKKQCPTCQGVPLIVQLFGDKVVLDG
jgi:hypothetical protein